MKLLKVKTARFSEMVASCGQPQSYTLWQDPKKDAQLKKLVTQHRLLTIRRTDGGAQFGEVGLRPGTGAMFLVFPKSLKRFDGQRIIGIKWELVRT